MPAVKHIPSCLFCCLALPLLYAQSGAVPEPEQPSVALPTELARVLTDYETAWRAKDSLALSRLFAEDGFVLSSGKPFVRGRAAIERSYRAAGGPLSLRAVAFAAERNTGYVIGAFTNYSGAPDRGKFTLTLRKDPSGRWLIMSDMDNDIRPPAPR